MVDFGRERDGGWFEGVFIGETEVDQESAALETDRQFSTGLERQAELEIPGTESLRAPPCTLSICTDRIPRQAER